MERQIQKIADDFLQRIKEKLPSEKANKPCLIGIVGMIGSGRTFLAKELVKNIRGAVLISANSARYLLKQENMSWGENVRECVFHAANLLIKEGYIVVVDGNQVDKEKRIKTQKLADELGIKYHLVRLITSQKTAEKYIDFKYSQAHKDSFEDFRPGADAEDLKQNLRERNEVYNLIDQEKPKPEFLAEIENEGTIEELKQKAIEVAQKIQE